MIRALLPVLIVFAPVILCLLGVAVAGRYFPELRHYAACDCCGKRRPLSRCFAYGIETYACDECRGWS